MADAAEYPLFDAFRSHMADVKLSVAGWNAQKSLAEATYTSGSDVLEMGYDPARYPAAYRRINGKWPYLADGILRESSWAVQGSTGRLEKGGAICRERNTGRQAYLQAVPVTDTFVGYNPLPDPMPWSLWLPGGMTVTARGKAGLLRVVACPRANRLWIDWALRPEQAREETADALLVLGTPQPPTVVRNEKPLAGPLTTTTVGGQTAYVIPLEK